MKRGEIWTVAAGSGFAGKPRPAIIIQDDHFSALNSVTVCLVSSDRTRAPLFRIAIAPTAGNGLKVESTVMVDKTVTVRRDKINKYVGAVSADDMKRIDQALIVFFGLAG